MTKPGFDVDDVAKTEADHFMKCPGCGASARWLPFGPGGRMLSAVGTMESSMSKAGLDNRHRNKDREIVNRFTCRGPVESVSQRPPKGWRLVHLHLARPSRFVVT
jgi:hypothetical protein